MVVFDGMYFAAKTILPGDGRGMPDRTRHRNRPRGRSGNACGADSEAVRHLDSGAETQWVSPRFARGFTVGQKANRWESIARPRVFFRELERN